jgi:hypothetical protein
MQMLITPEYRNLFPGGMETMEVLLHDIPSVSVIQLLALMDAELYAHEEDTDTQVKLLDLMLRRQARKFALR